MAARRLPAEAYAYYLGLGADRSYEMVAKEYGVSKRSVTKRASSERWTERVAEVERQSRNAAERRAVETLEAMNIRHLETLRVVQAKALRVLKDASLNSAMEAVRALDIAIKHERTIRGEPTDRTALSIEETIRTQHERWMQEEEG